MGFWKKLFGFKPANPTDSFPRRLVPPPLVWDTTSKTFCGIHLPGPFDSLVQFGPADTFKSLNEHYWILGYPSLGLELEVGQRQLKHATILISEHPGDVRPDYRFARPVIAPANQTLSPETTPEALAALLGPGENAFEEEEETILHFQNGSIRLEMCYSPDRRRLMRMEVYNDQE